MGRSEEPEATEEQRVSFSRSIGLARETRQGAFGAETVVITGFVAHRGGALQFPSTGVARRTAPEMPEPGGT
jgi:hypothetical protein